MNDTRNGVPARPATTGEAARGGSMGVRRVGLLGAGYIADWHAKALASVPGVRLEAVCDSALARARALAAAHGIPRAHASLEEMLAAGPLDAVHVLLPPDLHHRAARTLLEAGVHVFLEKPMCTSAAESDELVRLAEERGLRLGVGHNFLFAAPYLRLRDDLRAGVLGRIDHLTITWHWELPQAVHGPFDAWMLREPGNIMLEIGSHSVAHLLDLVGLPDELEVRAGNGIELPTGSRFYRRWQVSALRGSTAVDLRFSFVPGFGERTIHARGSLASATVDLDKDTYTLWQHAPADDDFDRYRMVTTQGRSLVKQARGSLARYILSKLKLVKRGNPYGASIAAAAEAFYATLGGPLEERVDGKRGAEVIRVCERIAAAGPRAAPAQVAPAQVAAGPAAGSPKVLVLGATGFIGQEVIRQLRASARPVRILARSPSKLPASLRAAPVECFAGDLSRDEDLRRALAGIDTVLHLARANVKSWADYQQHEIAATRRIAEAALTAGVKRFVYTGTIDSFYAGAGAGVIADDSPLDPAIEHRNLYARAKAESERLLDAMRRERQLPLVVVRPGIVIGRGGSPFHWGVGMWRHGGTVCEIWGEGTNKLPLVLVEDVARGLIAALDAPGIEGKSYNLVGDPCLSAQEYLDELDRCAGIRLQRHPTPISRFYLQDMMKWVVKMLVRHPERRRPSYRDWESRTQKATFDCSAARAQLGWRPVGDRAEFIRQGIEVPVREALG